jgi:hypothetical protein
MRRTELTHGAGGVKLPRQVSDLRTAQAFSLEHPLLATDPSTFTSGGNAAYSWILANMGDRTWVLRLPKDGNAPSLTIKKPWQTVEQGETRPLDKPEDIAALMTVLGEYIEYREGRNTEALEKTAPLNKAAELVEKAHSIISDLAPGGLSMHSRFGDPEFLERGFQDVEMMINCFKPYTGPDYGKIAAEKAALQIAKGNSSSEEFD